MLFVKKPFYINLIYSLLLLGLGLFAFFTHENFPDNPPYTALIGPAFGLVLLAMTPGLRSQNKVVAHLVVLLTLVFVIASAGMLVKVQSPESGGIFENRKAVIFIIWLFTGVTAMVLYIMNFMYNKKIRKALENDPSV